MRVPLAKLRPEISHGQPRKFENGLTRTRRPGRSTCGAGEGAGGLSTRGLEPGDLGVGLGMLGNCEPFPRASSGKEFRTSVIQKFT